MEVRVRAKRLQPLAGPASDRRRQLVHSLGKREADEPEDFEPAERSRPAFQPPRARPEVGQERPCRKCNTTFVVTNPFELRCKRCVHATYWKIGIVFAVIVIWKVLF